MADVVGVSAERLSAALPAVLLGFAASVFALPVEPDYALVFYLAVSPCTVARLALGRWPRIDAPLGLAIALTVWSGCTLLWGHDDGHRSAAFLLGSCCTLVWLLAMAAALADRAWCARLAQTLVAAGAGNAILSMVIGFVWHGNAARLTGWGITRHPILGAATMAIPYLLALHSLLRPGASARQRLLGGLAALVMAAFILFTDSRGPLLAAACATLLLCAAGPWRRAALPAFAVALALWAAPLLWPAAPANSPPLAAEPQLLPQQSVQTPAWLQPPGAEEATRRGTSHRLTIWAEATHEIRDRPVFGHGLASNMHLDVGSGEIITFPHDLYLSLLFYSGAVGLLLFFAMLAALARRLARLRRTDEFPWLAALLCNGLVAGLTDLGQITKGPGPIWLIVWLPVLLAATARLQQAPASSSRPVPGDRWTHVPDRAAAERRALDLS